MQAILQATQSEAELSREVADQSRQLTEDMKTILKATQAEAAMSRRVALQSQRLTEEMKKDGVAMKTVNFSNTPFPATELTQLDCSSDNFLSTRNFFCSKPFCVSFQK